jgi:circadian clock protein KaiC
LAFHLLAQAVLDSGNAMLVTTTHQPVSKMRAQYSGLSFLGPTGVFDQLDVLELDTDIEDDTLLRLLNAIVGRIQDHKVGVAAIDSFRAISDVSPNRGQLWRFLGTLSAQLVENNCLGILVGEYTLPRDLDLPELAMADVVIYLEVERLVAADLRTLRIYKMRGSKYVEGRQVFYVNDDGI